MGFGVTSVGFITKTLSDIQTEIDQELKNAFGNQINTLPESIFGQLKGIFAERESLIWELAEDVYNSQYPDTATGSSLDQASSLTDIPRLQAVASVSIGQLLFGAAGTVVPSGTRFSVKDAPSSIFETDESVTLTSGTDEIQTITFSATPTSGIFKLIYSGVSGNETTTDINWNDSASDIQIALNNLNGLSGSVVSGTFAAGFSITFAGNDGKQEQNTLTTTGNTLSDGSSVSVTITKTTPGVNQGSVKCTALTTGPIIANAGTLSIIDTPISGLTRTINPNDISVGRNIETDADYRARRANRLQISVAGPTAAIREAVLRLNEDLTKTVIESVTVFDNITLTTDSRGLPGKSFETVVYQFGGVSDRDQEIAEAIFSAKPAGIEAHGDDSFSVTDSQGFTHVIKHSKPTEIPIYLILDLTVTSDYPADGDVTIENKLLEWGNSLGVGTDVVVYPTLVSQLGNILGITDVVVKIGKTVSPTSDNNIVIDDGTVVDVELSRWDSARITINHV